MGSLWSTSQYSPFGLLQAGTEWLDGGCDMRYRCSGGEPLGDVLIFTFWFVTGRD